jgi:lipopolysaccharide transport system ATP-binding protein
LYNGNVDEAVRQYLSRNKSSSEGNAYEFSDVGNEKIQLRKLYVINAGRSLEELVEDTQPIELHTEFTLESEQPQDYHITFHLNNDYGEALFSFNHSGNISLQKGHNHLICTFPTYFFQPGTYYLSIFLVEQKKRSIWIEKDVASFTIADGPREIGTYMGREPGSIRPQFKWVQV